MRIFENQNLEDVLANLEALPDIFVVANTLKDKTFDSAAVFVFDARGILHVVNNANPKIRHIYEFSVPVANENGDFTGALTRDLRIGEGNCLIRENGQESTSRFYIREQCSRFFNRNGLLGTKLLANSEGYSERITGVLEEIIEKLPILYAFRETRNFVDTYMVNANPHYIGIKSVLQGRTITKTHFVNILPNALLKGRICAHRMPINLVNHTNHQFLFYFIVTFALITAAICLDADNSLKPALFMAGACVQLGNTLEIFNEYNDKHRAFLHCKRALNERAIKNKEISDEAISLAEEESRQAGEDLEGPEAKEREKALRHRALEIEKLNSFEEARNKRDEDVEAEKRNSLYLKVLKN